MQSRDEYRRVASHVNALFFTGIFIVGLLRALQLTPILHACPARAHAITSPFAAAIPAAPSHLTAKPVSDKRIDLAWNDNSTNEIGFAIERKTSGSAYAEVAVLGANVKRFSDSNLSANTIYFYRLRAYNAGGFSNYTNEASATTLSNSLAAPGHVTAQSVSATQIKLAWTDNSTIETGFKIERRPGAATNYTLVATVGANVTSFADTGLAAETKYSYRLRAYNAGNHSAYSTAVSAITLPTPPLAPSLLAAGVISQTQIDLEWSDNSSNEAGFKIERRIGNAGVFAEIDTAEANVTSFANSGLKANTKYFYRIRAYNPGGHSAYANAVEATTLRKPPAAPGSLTAVAREGLQINLAWLDNATNEDSFKIERRIGGSAGSPAGAYAPVAALGANATSYTDSGLTPLTMYWYRVRASNNGGDSDYANEAGATTAPAVPIAPGNLTATAMSNRKIQLAWTDHSNNETGFKIERKIAQSGSVYAEIARIAANASSFVDSSLAANTTYFYRVCAFNASAGSDYSNEANATTLPNPPATPGSLITIAASNNRITLAWADNSDNETGFAIERKMDTTGVYAEIALVPANVMNYSDIGLSSAIEYFYRVRAYNAGGHSGYSNEASATTLIAPGNLATVLITQNAIWKHNAGGTDLGATWKEKNYNDAGWLSGPAPLGFGETYIKTILPSKRTTYYFRNSFMLAEPVAVIRQLTLSANYDDGFVAYLNGQEVARQAMPAGTIFYNTLASSHEGGAYETIDLSAHVDKLVSGANVLAVEVHQNIATNNDLVLAMKLEYRSTRITRGPYLQAGAATQMVVRWRTDVATNSRVQYGVDAGHLALVADDPAATTEHEVKLTGLAPGTKYYYAVGTTDGRLANGNDFYFVTAPSAGSSKKTRIWVLGDAGTANADQIAVREAYYNFTGATHTDLWVMLGDNAYGSGTDNEYQAAVFAMYPTMLRKSVLWPAFGNHDSKSASSAPPSGVFYDIFTLPAQGEAGGVASGTEAYFSFDFANIHFICLNSEDIPRDATGAMLGWLKQDLTANTKPWTIAFWHHPPYSKGSHDSDAETALIEMRENALPILENGGVDLVLTGHSHSYERTFLLDGHYGKSGTLTSKMILDGGSGRVDGDGAYKKPTLGPASHEGAVYMVAGSSGKIDGGALNHPAMYVSLNALGSVVLEVDNNRVEATFLDQLGKKRDYFTVIKGVASALPAPSGLTAMAINSRQINLSWKDHSNDEEGFKIERKAPQSGGNYAPQSGAIVGANVTSYADTGLAGGTNYFYRVRAYQASGNSGYSEEAAANLAFSKIATASSSYGSNTPDQASDGSANTLWRSGNVGSNAAVWWRVDLGASYSINRVVIKWQSSFYAKNYQLQVSNDDAVYNTVYMDNAGNGGADEATLVPASGRYVRIYMTKNNGASERINEVEVYGSANAALNKASNHETDATVIPDKITLAQNYPNPFSANGTFGNSVTTISYALPAGMHVTLNVVNLNGQIVAALARRHHARGIYQVRFDASSLPSGIYFAVLQAGKVTQVRRMLLMK